MPLNTQLCDVCVPSFADSVLVSVDPGRSLPATLFSGDSPGTFTPATQAWLQLANPPAAVEVEEGWQEDLVRLSVLEHLRACR